MATRFLKILSNGNKILKSKLMTAPSYMIIFNFSFPFSIELQQATVLEAQIPIHIPHHEATQMEPKYIELTTQQLAQHLPPHSTTYSSPPPPPTTINLPTVAYRDFKFP